MLNLTQLSKKEMMQIHQAALQILNKTGLRIDCHDYYGPLEDRGAKVDRNTGIVRFPGDLVEEIIEQIKKEIADGYIQNILNGVVSGRCEPPFKGKVGGACVEFLDLENQAVREPTHQDLIDSLRLAEALPEVGIVGNPVVCLFDDQGKRVDPKMQRIVTAATVAKYTTKCGSTEVWNEKELELLIEIGIIVKGSKEEYLQQPCFITAKETIAPLVFPEEDGRILLMLARHGLPCTIVPMPLNGMSSPVSIVANVAITIAEVLGVMTALKVIEPDARFAAGVISGVLDMATTFARFAVPEAILQDLIAARIFNELYGQDFGVGTGYIDAPVPGPQAMYEKYAKMSAAADMGYFSPSIGILNSGKRHCPEQVILEIELGRHIEKCSVPIIVNKDTLAVDLINEIGIGGNFLSTEHTLLNFEELFRSKVDQNQAASDVTGQGAIFWAVDKKKQLLSEHDYAIDRDRAKAIDEVVAQAKKIL
jgi:trimethylamine---corrinoid protein Co-methyltransferase